MKKLFALLFLASAVLSSCSSDNDSFSGGDNNIKTEKYPVKFSVKSQGFVVDKSELKSFKGKQDYLFQVVVYKEDGKPYLDSLILDKDMQELLSEDGSLPLSLELPKGKYFLSFIYNPLGVKAAADPELWKFKPKNYSTDIAGGIIGTLSAYDGANIGNYYQTMSFSVSETSSDITTPITLEPMWSEVRLTIKDAATFKAPIGADYMKIIIEPAYRQYSLQTKLASYHINLDVNSVGYRPNNFFKLSDIRKEGQLIILGAVSKTAKEKNNLKIKFQFYNDLRENGYSLITEHITDLKEQAENGFNYQITGEIGNIANVDDSQAFSITLGEFNNKEINF